MKPHTHKAIQAKRTTRAFSGPVTTPINPAAHGNICHIDTCRCGATRRTNINGIHAERGPWQS